MQRLSKAVEDTGNVLQDAAAAGGDDAAAATATDPTPEVSPDNADTPAALASTVAVDTAPPAADATPADKGFEETKASDEEEEEPGKKVPSAAATKWHRELCSLAEMGFENTARNIDLLEKHVTSSGNFGMER